jgi:hypothetical protein
MLSQIANVAAVLAKPGLSALTGIGAALSAFTDSASSAASPATIADRVSISSEARARLAAESTTASTTSGGHANLDTDQGQLDLDIDAYFTPPPPGQPLSELPPLLLPSQNNLDALRDHIASAMPGFLAHHDIPAAPASVTYDNQGQIQLPADYPYADKFKQALAEEPVMAREMSALNALSSHKVELDKALAFQQEYAAAHSQAEIDAVLAKYSELLSDNRQAAAIELHFAATGELSVTADGRFVV